MPGLLHTIESITSVLHTCKSGLRHNHQSVVTPMKYLKPFKSQTRGHCRPVSFGTL